MNKLPIIITLLFVSCNTGPNIKEDAIMMAKLQFEAKSLQDVRFAYSDSLNKADAIKLNSKQQFSQTEMEQFYRRKQDLSTETAILSSIISAKMDSLFAKSYKSKEERAKFDTELEIAFNKIIAEKK